MTLAIGKHLDAPLHALHDTPFGTVAALWSVDGGAANICRILLSKPETPAELALAALFPLSKTASCPEVDDLFARIDAFLNGEPIRFSLDAVRLDLCSAFQQSVLRAEHAIPRGSVSTYHLIARQLHKPNGARAVGTALAKNPFPIVVPCHRAIRSDGALGGYQGGLKMKRALLEMEGVAFRDRDHVSVRDFHYGDREAFEAR